MEDKYKKSVDIVNEAEKKIADKFDYIEKIYNYNQFKVLKAFIDSKVSESHFVESTGYGYSDIGRDKIEEVYAKVFNTESALVRQQIVSGTHALSIALFSLLNPGDNFLSITGMPYDTLSATIGVSDEMMSLKSYNISFDKVELVNNNFDYDNIKNKIKDNTKLIYIQRSRGYSDREAISLSKIADAISFIKNINNNLIVLVDNCYGEFVECFEPTDVGADIMCGSLIKNPGGGLAKSGGYIVGKKELIEKCSYRLTAPGIGSEVGVNFNQNRNVLQGLYLAPQIVNNCLKIVLLFSYVLNIHKIDTIPMYNDDLNDIVISIKLLNKEKLLKFCKIIQETSPIDSFLEPYATDMPGYDSKVVMAAGCFVSGSSIELSCDAPLREPYMAFLQGGLSYYQGKYALMKILSEIIL
ncbi:MAG: methionine gamma-lyase family protein [Lachnospiraceae bacterium]|nr:methionine gamma-lyase family protein [Lachnospiraceae bacterium]